MATATEDSSNDQVRQFQEEVRDAKLLLEFAVASGKPVENRLVQAVKFGEEYLRSPELPSPGKRIDFEIAYRDLAQAMAPVTAATLKATSDSLGRVVIPLAWKRPVSEAKLWSRKLWLYTILIATVVVSIENYLTIQERFYAIDEDTTEAQLFWFQFGMILQSLVPFAYGGLGAVTYLLRSAHEHIYARTFDPNRMPEYYNRLLLGVIAGGSLQLFVAQIAGEGSTVVHISAAALGFLAGYNCDILFSTVERVSNAILPKVGIDTVRRADAPRITGLSLKELLDQLNQATDPEVKATLQGLIAKIKERL